MQLYRLNEDALSDLRDGVNFWPDNIRCSGSESKQLSALLLKSISSASKLWQWHLWRTEICAAKIREFNIRSGTLAAPANDMKNRWQSMN
jgi:hypothetical protein